MNEYDLGMWMADLLEMGATVFAVAVIMTMLFSYQVRRMYYMRVYDRRMYAAMIRLRDLYNMETDNFYYKDLIKKEKRRVIYYSWMLECMGNANDLESVKRVVLYSLNDYDRLEGQSVGIARV